MTIAPCDHVEGSSTPLEFVRLWDGRDHCRACVEAASPGLWEYAQGRDCLEDSIPFDRAGGLRVWWRYVGLFFGVWALVGAGFFVALEPLTTLGFLAASGGCLAFGLLVNLTSVYKARKVLPTVRVRDGVVEVFRPFAMSGRPVATYRLLDARWHLGRLNEDTFALGRGGAIVPARSAVLLRAPQKRKGVAPASEVTATGSTPEMIRIWRGFLKLAGVSEGR